jgi:hypothetical protein
MFAELLFVATLVAGEQEKIIKDDRYVADRISNYVTSRADSRQARCAVAIAYKESRYQAVCYQWEILGHIPTGLCP